MLSIIISTIVFFIAGWYIKRYLDDMEIPKGMTRGVLIFSLAAAVSWGVGSAVNWMQGKPATPHLPSNLSQPLKEAEP